MLNTRIKKLTDLSNNWLFNPSKRKVNVDIRDRHPALLALEGWYESEVVIPQEYQAAVEAYHQSGSDVKLTRWLTRSGVISIDEASKLGKCLETTQFKVSCRHKDLIRLAETHHYSSCMDGGYGRQQLQYLADPDVAVVFVPDKAGKYSWRSLARLVMDDPYTYGLVMYRVYGNGPTQAIFEALDKKIRVYQALDIRHGRELQGGEYVVKVSPTVHNNKFLSRPIWTDSKGVGWDAERRVKIRVIPRGEKIQYVPQEVRYPYIASHAF